MRRNALSSIGPMIGFVYSFFSEVIACAEVHFCPDVFTDDYRNVSLLLSTPLSIFGLFFLVCSGFKWQAIREDTDTLLDLGLFSWNVKTFPKCFTVNNENLHSHKVRL